MAILTTTALFLMTVSSIQALTCYSCEKKKLESGEILVETGGNCLEVTQVCTGPGEVCVQGNYEIMYRGKKQIYVYSKLCDIPCDDADQCNETFCSTDLCNDMTVQQTTDYVYGQKEREEESRSKRGRRPAAPSRRHQGTPHCQPVHGCRWRAIAWQLRNTMNQVRPHA